MITQDGQYVVFLGKEYHYIFNDHNDIVKHLLFSPYRFLMSIVSTKTHIKLFQSNDLEANIVIKLNVGDLDPIAQKHFSYLGFRHHDNELVLQIKLYGKRYLADRDLSEVASRLNHQYVIKISHDDFSAAEKIGKAALTPITATIDATLLIGKILLIPLSGN